VLVAVVLDLPPVVGAVVAFIEVVALLPFMVRVWQLKHGTISVWQRRQSWWPCTMSHFCIEI